MKEALNEASFDEDCRACPRLAAFLDEVRVRYPDYHCAPVPAFGDPRAPALIVGLAPGLHGANATGRPFTGDHAGIILYETLHRHGFASQSQSRHDDDGMRLIDCRLTNAVKCLPPQNKPIGAEINTCNRFLQHELAALARPAVILALGGVAHRAVLKALGLKLSGIPFAHHGVAQPLDGLTLISSYHCSRYNTQTKRLTGPMFDAVIRDLRRHADRCAAARR